MSLTSILNEISKHRPNAEMDVLLGSPNTHIGRVGLKNAAVETVKRLKLEYRNELMASTIFIVVTGSNQQAFSDLACGETFGCFSSDPESFYKDIASRVNPTLFGREGIRQLFNIAGNILEDKALELDVASYPMLQFNEKYNRGVANAEEFASVLKNAINDQVGPEMVGINAIHSIVDKAIASNHSASVTPVILSTSDEKFAQDLYKALPLLKSKTFLVVAGKVTKTFQASKEAVVVKNVNEETVGEALSTLRNRL